MIVIMRDAVMPECCKTCVCSEGYGCGITGTEMTTKEMESRPDWCPLEEVEPCEDAVSREAVYEAMVEKGQRSRRYRLGETWELNGTEIREALDTVPSVTPKQKTGKWIHSDFSHEFLQCSECGRGRYFCSNFCPNCGADMRQREENK